MKYITYLFLLFILYSFIGYICEMINVAYKNKKIVNRGFLCGPILPIYGLGSIFILFALLRYKEDPIVVFVFGMIICSALEYFTSFILEKIFHNMWWDYFDFKYNLNGRICLFNSFLFGIGAILIIYFVQPILDLFLQLFSRTFLNIIALVFAILFLLDVIYSFVVAFNLRNRLIIVEELKNQKLSKIPQFFERALKDRVKKFKIYPNRLLNAFPKIKIENKKEFNLMKKFKGKK